ncbi:flavin reductase family protein [uncultured Friedmanniella sp.]|uniref:flavin reductase family protein n=1 Tax=uncultured Friedmanniella sp. TaxID=335381 RepID=UPI0035CA1BC3
MSVPTSPLSAEPAAPASVPESFRQTMACVVTPVAVVTTVLGGRAHGTTVSAWVSLSMTPPMILVSLDQRSRLLGQLRESRRFGLNILSADQAGLAETFASKDQDKFGLLDWHYDAGLPRLGGLAGWVACDVAEFVTGGDHVVALGTVVAAEPGDAEPLSYHARRFGTHTPFPVLDGR